MTSPTLLVMDVDSTLIREEVIELIADHAGTRTEVAEITERAMRGELDFAASLTARVATLAGLPESVLADVGDAVHLTEGARTLIDTMHGLGHVVALVSGGFIEVVAPLADDLGIVHAHANALEVQDGHLTGRVRGPIIDRATKAAYLADLAVEVGAAQTVAVGDGANDLDMVTAADVGIAFCAKPALREAADVCLDEPRLDRVLDVLGLR